MTPGETLAGPGDITLNEGRSVINKIDLASLVGADLAIMEADARRMRPRRPFVFSNLKDGTGVDARIEDRLQEMMGRPLTIAEITDRIAAIRKNLREMIEQAAARRSDYLALAPAAAAICYPFYCGPSMPSSVRRP